jgi:predicted transcriptional regulator
VLTWKSVMSTADDTSSKQNVTVRIDRQTLRRAKILAAKRNTSISRLLAEQIEHLVGTDDAYEQAQRQALDLLDRGFHLGGQVISARDEWHER